MFYEEKENKDQALIQIDSILAKLENANES